MKSKRNKIEIKDLRCALLILIVIIISGCGRGKDSRLQELNRECNLLMSSPGNKLGLDSLAIVLLEESVRSKDKDMEGLAYLYLSHFEQGLPDSIKDLRTKYLSKASKIAEETDNNNLRIRVLNQRGIWELDNLGHILTAQYWFKKSMEAAEKTGSRELAIPAEMNLSETYRLNDDTIGIKYDLELFKYAIKNRNDLQKFTTAFHCATHFAKTVKDTVSLEPYIAAMRPLETSFEGSIAYIYAIFYYNKGDFKKAEQYILNSDSEHTADLLLLHAKILNKTGRYKESLEKAMNLKNMQIGMTGQTTINLFKLIADNYHRLGDYANAYITQQKLESFTDSLNEVRSADQTRRYRIEYEVYSKDREISEQRLRNHNLTLLIGTIILFVLATTIISVLWLRRRNKMYRDIVRQNCETLEYQKYLVESITRKDARIQELEKYMALKKSDMERDIDEYDIVDKKKTLTHISTEKVNRIFDLIQYYSIEKQIWRDISVTREKFADMVGCNRTYFSEVLKQKTGMSYTQYMNSCRVSEAIRVLSTKDDNTSIKDLSSQLGFLSTQTFHTSFKNATGMSPDRYRKTVREL